MTEAGVKWTCIITMLLVIAVYVKYWPSTFDIDEWWDSD